MFEELVPRMVSGVSGPSASSSEYYFDFPAPPTAVMTDPHGAWHSVDAPSVFAELDCLWV